MRMTDRQVQELKKKFEPLVSLGTCMDCDDHPDEKLDGYCSEGHRAAGYAETIVGLCDELLRYKALAKKHELPEPREDEAATGVESDEDRDKRLLARFNNLKTAMGSVRDEHETTAGGEYKRCACDLCAAHRQMEDPNMEIERLTEDYGALSAEYEALCLSYDTGVVNGDRIRTDLHSAVGFFTKSPAEMAKVVYEAVRTAMKDAKFKAFYDEKRRDSRARRLDEIKRSQQMRQLTEDFEKLSSELETIEALARTGPRAVDPTALKELRDRHSKVAAELARIAER